VLSEMRDQFGYADRGARRQRAWKLVIENRTHAGRQPRRCPIPCVTESDRAYGDRLGRVDIVPQVLLQRFKPEHGTTR